MKLPRIPPTTGLRGRSILAVPAEHVQIGDTLLDSGRAVELRVIAKRWERVRADGKMYAEHLKPDDDASVPHVSAIVLNVLNLRDRTLETLGAFAAHTRLQVLRNMPRDAP